MLTKVMNDELVGWYDISCWQPHLRFAPLLLYHTVHTVSQEGTFPLANFPEIACHAKCKRIGQRSRLAMSAQSVDTRCRNKDAIIIRL